MSNDKLVKQIDHLPCSCTRRDFLFKAGSGLGGLALSCLLAQERALADGSRLNLRGDHSPLTTHHSPAINPLAPKAPHFPGTAKSVIFLFMVGGPSHVETFDPKPALDKMHGQKMPDSYGKITSQFTGDAMRLQGSAWKFNRYGQSGIEVSDLLPHMAQCVDDMAIIRSCYSDSFVHAPAMYGMISGRTAQGHPSVGSWVTYGLGCVTDNLPAYCVMTQPEGLPEGGAPMWGSGYLPAAYQGTQLRNGAKPILDLDPPAGMSRTEQKRMLDYVREMNEMTLTPDGTDLSARIASYELAFKMQQHAPEAVDFSRETAETKSLYGVDDPATNDFGSRCLLARRLVERGVRFVQLFSGGGPVSFQWDAHDNVVENHTKMAGLVDKPIAGL